MNDMKRRWIKGLLVAIVLLGLPAAAEAQTGRIVGRVISAQTAEPLASAQVFVGEGTIGALSSVDGRYVLRDVPAGIHEVHVERIGFGTKTVTDVEVTRDETVVLDVTLESRAVDVEGVVVTSRAERGSTTALMSERRRSAVVSDAIGSEQMARTPDGDAGAALRRVPGLSVVDGKFAHVRGLGGRYSATTLNGAPLASPVPDKNAIPLDVIPSGLLQSIVTSKSYSPDQSGDQAGGLVQLRTRDFPANRIFSVSVSGGWNSTATFEEGLGYRGGDLDLTGFDDGTRGLPAGIARDVQVTPTNFSSTELQEIGRGFEGGWGPTERSLPPNFGLGATFGDDIDLGGDRRLGFITSVNYSSSQSVRRNLVERVFSTSGVDDPVVDYTGEIGEHSISLGALANVAFQPRAGDQIKLQTVYNRLTDDVSRVLTGFNLDSNTDQWNSRVQYLGQSLLNSQLEGEHLLRFLSDATFKWRGALTRANRYEPSTREVLYREFDGQFYWDDFIQSGSVFHQDMVDSGWNGAASLRLPFELAGLPASLSAGSSVEHKDREAYTRRFRFRPQSGGTIGNDVRTLAPDELFGASSPYIAPDGFEIREATFRTDNYDARQTIEAAYLMAELEPVPGLRFSGGARVERTSQAVSPKDLWDTGLPPVEGADIESTDLLPAINATLSLSETMNLRASASRTLARAELRELAPFSFADYAGGFLVIGNPQLEGTRISNFDLRWEWFGGPQSVVAVSGFYKEFSSPIETFVLPSSELMKTWVNAREADNYGVEVEARSDLGFLSEGLRSLSVNANTTLVVSDVTTRSTVDAYVPGTGPTEIGVDPKSRGLQGQSPYVLNLGVTWDDDRGASASILFNRFGRRIDAVGAQASPEIYEEARGQLDAVLQWPIASGWSAKLSANRLLGNQVEFTQGGGTLRSYEVGRSLSLSLSWGSGR
ncbi:MAG: carboxypeptidase regulatory-like domain-containing protein [Gemmatimonadota bacterium]|nr:carboxypeptidase regulatory-like domain-containing protein [Gemmatimonadota bacterium]